MMLMSTLKRLVCLRYPFCSQRAGVSSLSFTKSSLLSSTPLTSSSTVLLHSSVVSPLFVLQSSLLGHHSGDNPNRNNPKRRSKSIARNNRQHNKKSIHRSPPGRVSFSTTRSSSINMPKRKKSPKIYAVAAGRSTGLFQTWAECEAQVKGYPKAVFKSFSTQYEAEVFLRQHDAISASSGASGSVNDFISTNHKRPKNDQNSHVRDVVSNDVSCHTSDSSPPAAPPQSTSHQEPSSFAIPLPLSARVQKIIFHINFDGGSRGNPKGVAGAGAHVLTRTFYTLNDGGSAEKVHRTVTDIRKFLGKGSMTNNQAEYMGAIAGLENVLVTMQQTSINLPSSIAKDSISIKILVQGDSNLVVQQLKGNWACKSANMQPLLRDTKKVLRDIEKFLGTASNYSQHGRDKRLHIDFEHVYRKDNTIADQLANEAMDAENSWTTTRHDLENGGGGNGNCGKKMGKIVYV